MSAMPLEKQEIEYPTSDGQPMAEKPEHQQVMIDLIEGLRDRYREAPDVWVGGNFFLCYEEGNPNAHVSPDVMVAKGVEKKEERPNYLLWEEKPPSLIVEVTSKSTYRYDEGDKKDIYEQIGAKELVLFDVLGEYLHPRLQGYVLEGGRYRRLSLEKDGSLLSRTTGLLLKPEGKRLRLVDAVTGERILWEEELRAARALAEKRAAEEAAARRAAEARAAQEAAVRRAAEARAAQEAAARRVAEVKAAEEAAARRAEEAALRAAEERIRALEEELNHLRKGQGG